MSQEEQQELAAIAARYSRRNIGDRYSLLRPEVWQMLQERQRELLKILAMPDIKTLLEDNSYTIIGGSPDNLQNLMVDGIARFGKIIDAAGIKPD